MDNGVQRNPSKSKLNVDSHYHSNYLNYMNRGVRIISYFATTGHQLLTSPDIADMYTSWMNTWNTLPESYQQRVYKNTLATGKNHIQQAENPMPALVISVDSASVDNAILLGYLTSEVVHEESEIRSTGPTILIDTGCPDDGLHLGYQCAIGITKMIITKATTAMPLPLPDSPNRS